MTTLITRPAGSTACHTIRPLRHGEHAPLLHVFDGLSAQSRYQRFHAATTRLTQRALAMLSDVHPSRHVALVIEVNRQPAGIGRWIRDLRHPERAEVALEVRDDHQREGLATALLRELARAAALAEITELTCYVAYDNAAAAAMVRSSGARRGGDRDQYLLPVSRLLPSPCPIAALLPVVR